MLRLLLLQCFLVDDDLPGGEVPVDDHEAQPGLDGGGVDRERLATVGHDHGQRVPRHELEREAPPPVVLEQLVQAHEMRMDDVREPPKFLLDAVDRARLAFDASRDFQNVRMVEGRRRRPI